MSTHDNLARVRVVRDTYLDSLRLLVATSVMAEQGGVTWAGAVMATPSGRENLEAEGFGAESVGQAGANDLVLAVRAGDEAAAEAALAAGEQAAFEDARAESGEAAAAAPRTVSGAVAQMPDASVAIVSVPGGYAALEAHHALSQGLHVLLFSDNVSLDEEAELKKRGNELGLLVMGPGAGTAVISGTGLGFANAVRRGPVGVVAAAGTGAQEVSALLDRWGVGVSHVIGVGGRDLSEAIGGRMAKAAVRALDEDPETEVILLVSKPPSEAVAHSVLEECGSTPAVAAFLGLSEMEPPSGVRMARTLEEGALTAARLAGKTPPATSEGLRAQVEERLGALGDERRTVRGYYSGGTLCYEAQVIINELLGEVYSNEPLLPGNTVPAPPGSNVLLDLGAEEYTVGRPHPMIDPGNRIQILRQEARDPEVAVVLLDVVLGYGSHEDPAGQLAPVLGEIMADGGPQVVAYVLGSDTDPQGYARQRATLEGIGCLVTETAARAAYTAAAIASRRPELTESHR
ncbi:FdrA family protein [Nonomuraea ferruginea]|uniref:FdrA family protein n=1 Tax=Nonomuraea ferruginea TaxID=46174 RepID=A0ABT4SV53_9ACTN|nr:FdrA family protein [Nonomuraea ferruginea]MDA0641039.1 FdrA family protein [Nonomuraea ferruginea]